MYNQLGQGSGHQTGPPPPVPPPHSAPGPTAPYMDIFGYNNFGLAIGQPLRGNPYLSAHDESAYYSRDTYGDTFSTGVETGMGALTLDFMNTDLTGQTVGTPSFQPTKPATPSVGVPQVAVPKALPGHSGIGNLFDVFKRLDSINSNSSSVGLSGSSCVVGQSIKKPSWASVASQPAKGGHGHSSATNHHYHGHHSQQSHQHHGHHSQQSQHHHGHLIQQSQHHHGHHIQQNQHHHGHFGSSNAGPQGSTGNVTGSGARRDAGNVAVSVPERGTGGGNGIGSISGNSPSTGVRSGGGARNGGSRINVGSVGTSVNPNVAGGLTNSNSIVPLDCSGQNYSPLTSGPVYPSHPILDKLRVENNYNLKEFDLSLKDARFFIIKSYSEDDIHRSIKYSIWCSTEHGNKRLDTAFKSQENKGPIYLFYSVNGSGHFCGMAQMLSMVDYNSSSNVWAQDKWKGQFKVKWIYVKDVPNAQLRHIRLENNENKPVTNSRDTQEVPYPQGKTVLKIMHNYRHTTSIFDDFLHYEKRQEEEYQRRVAGDPPPNNSCGLSGSSNNNTTTAITTTNTNTSSSSNHNNNQQQQQQKTTKVLNSTKENNQF